MSRIIVAVVCSWSIPAGSWAQSRGGAAPPPPRQDQATLQVEAEVLAALRGRLEAAARNDTAAWASFVADECLTPLEGEIPSKAAWVKRHASWPSEVKYFYGPLEDVKVRVHGDTAIVAFHSKQFTEFGGQTSYQHRWQIETWMRREEKWLLVAVADGVIPLEPTAATVDPAVYDAYVGQYEWAPDMISTVTREGDKLIERFTGQGPSELLPETDTTFFVRGEAASGDSSRFVFVRDGAGRVTHFIHRELGGTDRVVKKIR